MRNRTLTAVAAVTLSCAITLHAQPPGVGASQVVIQHPLGGTFTLRSPGSSNYVLQFPDMSGVPAAAGVLLLLDNSGPAPHPLTPLPPTSNSVLTSGGGTVGWQTSLPSGLTIPSPAITGGTIDGTVIGGTTPAAGSFTTLHSSGASTMGTGDGLTNTFGTGQGAQNTIGYGVPNAPDASTTYISGNVVSAALDGRYWGTSGNTAAASDFIGTINAQALEVRVNTAGSGGTGRVMRYEPNGTSANLIGGYNANSVGATTVGATIGGGGASGSTNTATGNFSTIGGGDGNSAGEEGSTIAGGRANTVGVGAEFGTVGGGRLNDIAASTGTVGGGRNNDIIGTASANSTIAGGLDNSIASATGTIAGGVSNHIGTNSAISSIGGGINNVIDDDATLGTIANGNGNSIASGAVVSTISGGATNQIGANTNNSTISGGSGNQIGADAAISTISGGWSNIVAANAGVATIGGGRQNGIAATIGTVGGGQNNQIISAAAVNSTIGGGLDNSTSSALAVIGGGQNNHIDTTSPTSTIGGGQNNHIGNDAALGTIAGGSGNTIATNAAVSTIGGGLNNVVSGGHSAIVGGRGLTLAGSGSVGFLGGNTGSRDMVVSANNTAVLGNTDLWLANNDGSARQLRLYEAETAVGAFPTGSTNYTALQAGTQLADITYTLPTAAPTANGQVLGSTTGGTMSWIDPTPTGALSLSNNSAATPTLTLSNTNTDGVGLHVSDGRVLLSYGSGSTGTIPSDVAVWEVADDGTGSGVNAALPAVGTNGQILYVLYNDADAGSVGGTAAVLGDRLTFLYVAGAWQLFHMN